MTASNHTTFFRLLKTPIDDKGDALAAQIAALNTAAAAGSPLLQAGEGPGERAEAETYTLDPADFSLIPGSPFAYWVSDSLRQLFKELPKTGNKANVRQGLATANDFRFVRAWWEIPPQTIAYTAQATLAGQRWARFAKGGVYCPFYDDVHLVVDWGEEGERVKAYICQRYPYLNGKWEWVAKNTDFYFRPGLTWPRRTTSGISVRAMPAGCIFADKGPVAFVRDDAPQESLALLAVMNSVPFAALVKLQLGAATAAARSYEVGVIQRTPIPLLTQPDTRNTLSTLAREAHGLQRDRDRTDETTHAFCLPGLVQHREAESLLQASLAPEAEAQAAQARLSQIQAEIDEIVFDLYGLSETDRALVRAEMDESANQRGSESRLTFHVQNLLMWSVGVAFGRWDVRFALDPTLLPPLQGPFDPLPRCAPGALVGPDGLPARKDTIADEAWLRARRNVLDIPSLPLPHPHTSYPLPIPWDSIRVDDPTHPSDIVTRVRGVLTLLWGDRADGIEREACEILGVKGLRDYFRDARKGFFAFHVKRYSKSRRKAPIYWLLQSEKRNYGIWLYVHRLRPDTLFAAGRDYADAKVTLEETRLEELRQGLALSLVEGLDGLDGSAHRRREREIERQQKLVAEVTEFRDRLDRIALLNLPPDLNDGVVISISPLWELVPWKEAQRTWEKIIAGEYPWSTMAQQMRERGLVKA